MHLTGDSTRPCVGPDCDRRVTSSERWKAMDAAARDEARAEGVAQHIARGLCSRCYYHAGRNGTLVDYPTIFTSGEVVLDEYRHLGGDPDWSQRHRATVLADRLGMTTDAVERALTRARTAA